MTEKITITYEDALLGLKRQVALKGEDYVYKKIALVGPIDELYQGSCVNWINGEASCIVGHYVAELLGGVPNSVGANGFAVDALLGTYGIDATDKAKTLLSLTQNAQDAGTPWGRAVESAAAFVAEIEGP